MYCISFILLTLILKLIITLGTIGDKSFDTPPIHNMKNETPDEVRTKKVQKEIHLLGNKLVKKLTSFWSLIVRTSSGASLHNVDGSWCHDFSPQLHNVILRREGATPK